jgi:dTDP-4-amino-4,6-dideoxygalactose transaminase
MAAPQSTHIPFLDLYAGNRRVETAFFRDLKTLYRSSGFIGGPAVEGFEGAFAKELDSPHCVAVSSGTAALHLSMAAAGIGAGDEVIVPAFTFPGAAGPVLHRGARPVFADVNLHDGCLNPEAVAHAVTKNTRAILATHLFGHPADLDALRAIVRGSKNRIMLIEDAAQAHGGSWRGQALGTHGTFGCFSFYPTKNLGAMGDAGAIMVKTRALAERLQRLRDHGQVKRFAPVEAGFNARMDAVQALFLTHKIPLLRADNARRASVAARILGALETPETHQADLVPLRPDARGASAWHALVVRAARRAPLMKALTARGIGHQVYYPTALPDLKVYKAFTRRGDDFPAARALARTALTLPLHPALTRTDIETMIQGVRLYSPP